MLFRTRVIQKHFQAGLLAVATLTGAAFGLSSLDGTTPAGHARRAAPHGRSTISVDVDLTLVPVTVTDLWDHPFRGLGKDDFRIFENGLEQEIVSFNSEDAPVSVGIVFDTSRSMRNELGKSIAALEELFKTTMPGDEFFAVSFSSSPQIVSGFTPDGGEILRDLASVQAHGWTALYDAILVAVQRMKSARNPRKALFILSDGADNYSRYTASEVRDVVRECDVRIYAVGLFERPGFLKKMADESGGRAVWIRKSEELPEAVYNLSEEMRSYYLLGYKSSNPERDGKYRKLKVELIRPTGNVELHTSWRRGYYAPAE